MSVKTDPLRMNMVAKLAFTPVYDYLAEQIRNKFDTVEGICIDIGSGPASLAISIARITDLTVYSLDIQPEMTSIAINNIDEAGLTGRVIPVTADVIGMPFEKDSVDLIISRGSIFFWEDRPAAFREIYRVLKPGAVAYCGGGMGNDSIRKAVEESFDRYPELAEAKELWLQMMGKVNRKITIEKFHEEMSEANIKGEVIKENGGIWVQIKKAGV